MSKKKFMNQQKALQINKKCVKIKVERRKGENK